MFCKAYLHDQKPIEGFCLNILCVISSECCSQCLMERHQKHQEYIKDVDTVKQLIQYFIEEQNIFQNLIDKLDQNDSNDIMNQIKNVMTQLRNRFTRALELIKEKKYEEITGGMIAIKQWYNFFHVNKEQNIQKQLTILKGENHSQQALEVFKNTLNELQEQLYYYQGVQLMQYELAKEASEQFQKALQINDSKCETICQFGRSLLEQRKYDEALTFLEYGLQINPNYQDLYVEKAYALFSMKQFDEGLIFIEKALQINPKCASAMNIKGLNNLLIIGLLLKGVQQNKESLKCYQKAIEYDSEHLFPYINIGWHLVGSKKFEESMQWFNQAIKSGQYPVLSYFFKGTALESQGEFEEAKNSLDEALKLNSKHLDSLFRKDKLKFLILGFILIKQEKYDEAFNYFNQISTFNLNYENLSIWKGKMLIKLKKYDEAAEFLNQAIEQNNKDPQLYILRAKLLQNQQKVEEAINQYRKLIEIFPNYSKSYKRLGEILEQQNQLNESLLNYQKAYELNPEDQRTSYKIINLLSKQNKGDEATQAIMNQLSQELSEKPYQSMVLVFEGNFEEAYNNISQHQCENEEDQLAKNFCQIYMLISDGNNEEALNLVNDLQEDYQEPILNYLKGQILFYKQEYDEAIIIFDELIMEIPQFPMSYFFKCLILMDQEKYEVAHQSLEYTLVNNKDTFSYILKGQLLLREGKINEAKAYLVKAVEMDSTFANIVLAEGDQLQYLEGEELTQQLMMRLMEQTQQNPGLMWKYFPF